jgi:hypothetical protein
MIILVPLLSLIACVILEIVLEKKLRPRVVRVAFKRKRQHAFKLYVVPGNLSHPTYLKLEKEIIALRRRDKLATHLPWVLPTLLWVIGNCTFLYLYR